MNMKYKFAGSHGKKHETFRPGDLICLHFRKDWFPNLRKYKLLHRVNEPFKVLERINDNTYKLELFTNFGDIPTFNIFDLRPFLRNGDKLESRAIQMQEVEEDEDISLNDTTLGPFHTIGHLTHQPHGHLMPRHLGTPHALALGHLLP